MVGIKNTLLAALIIQVICHGSWGDDLPDRQPQLPDLMEALENNQLRYGASLALVRLQDKAVPALRHSLATGTGDLAVWSAYTLGEIGPPAKPAVRDLMKALSSSDEALRAATAEALGKIGPAAEQAVEALSDTISDSQLDVRSNSVIALGKIGVSRIATIEKLIQTLADNQLRKLAYTSLLQIGTSEIDPFITALKDDRLKFDVSRILLKLNPKRARKLGLEKPRAADVKSLGIVLNDPTRSQNDRIAAASSLVALEEQGCALLIAAFTEESVSRTAAEAFISASESALPQLKQAMSHKKPEVRRNAAYALQQMEKKASEVIPELIQLLTDDDRQVRYHAVRALHSMEQQAKPAVPALIKTINNSKEQESTRQWAIKTLVVTLPDTREVVVDALIAASKEKGNYGVSSLARQHVRAIDLKAAEAAGVK